MSRRVVHADRRESLAFSKVSDVVNHGPALRVRW